MPPISTQLLAPPYGLKLDRIQIADWKELVHSIYSQRDDLTKLKDWADLTIQQLNDKFLAFMDYYNLLSSMLIPDYSNNLDAVLNNITNAKSVSSRFLDVKNAGKSAAQSAATATDVDLAVTFTYPMTAAPTNILLGIQELSDPVAQIVSVSANNPTNTGFTAHCKVIVAVGGATFRFSWIPLGL
jgi:hypothetical protein